MRSLTTALIALALGVLLAPLAAISASAAPATRYVGVGQAYSSINSAIQASANGDTVQVNDGTYTENINIVGRYVFLRGNVSNPAAVVVQSAGAINNLSASPLFLQNIPLSGVHTMEVAGFTFTGGNVAEGQGGGITIDNASPTIHHNRVIGNTAGSGYGGGIAVTRNSNPFIYSNEISGNHAFKGGGGIFAVNGSAPVIVNNTITANTTSGVVITDGGASGGGVYLENIVGNNAAHISPVLLGNTITGNTAAFAGGGVMMRTGIAAVLESNVIDDNDAPYGGGVHIETGGAGPTLWGNTITSNTSTADPSHGAPGAGGGVAIYDDSTPTITNNTITGNSATLYGGGIVSQEGANSTVTGNIISDNATNTLESNADGGGIYVAKSTMIITNNQIDNNGADLGGGIAVLDEGRATIVNNTIVKNDQQSVAGGAIFISPSGTVVSVVNNVLTENQGFAIFEARSQAGQPKARIDNNLFGTPDSSSDSGLGFYYSYLASNGSQKVTTAAALNSDSAVDAAANRDGAIGFTNLGAGDFSITSGSDAVNHATTVSVPAITVDIRAVARSTLDIGAYEYSASPVSTLAPSLFGDAEVSKFVNATTGSWGPLPASSYGYQWQVDGADVAGENNANFSPRLNDVGLTSNATVTVTKYGVYNRSQSTAVSAPIVRGEYFADVPSTSAFSSNIAWMATQNISTGTANSPYAPLYKPADSVSRQAMAAFLYRLSNSSFTAPVDPTFADVDSTKPFYTEIEWMADAGISVGTEQPSGKPLFKPADPVSRQAMALFLARYVGVDVSIPPTELSFDDVPLNASTASSIAWMKEAGISTGTAQTTGLPLYKPLDPVSRQAMAAFLFRVDQLP